MSSVTQYKEYLGGRWTKSKQIMSMWTFEKMTKQYFKTDITINHHVYWKFEIEICALLKTKYILNVFTFLLKQTKKIKTLRNKYQYVYTKLTIHGKPY